MPELEKSTTVEDIVNINGEKYIYRWDSGHNVDDYKPYNMVNAICFDDDGKILVQFEYGKWRLQGGGPERGESYSETLVRELFQETGLRVKDLSLLGAFYVRGPKKNEELNDFYQLCVFCRVKDAVARSPDPEDGTIDPIKFIKPEEFDDYIKWGKSGKLMFSEAVKHYLQLKSKQKP